MIQIFPGTDKWIFVKCDWIYGSSALCSIVSWETDIPISLNCICHKARKDIVVKAFHLLQLKWMWKKNNIEIEIEIYFDIHRHRMDMTEYGDAADVNCFLCYCLLVCVCFFFTAKVYCHLFISNHIQLRIESTLFHILYSLLHLNSAPT